MPPVTPHPFQPRGEFPRSIPGFDTVPRITGVDPSSSRITGGGAATITGFNFNGVPTVKFGTLTATSVVVLDANTITCVIPVATDDEIVDVSVTVGSQVGTASAIFTYFTSTIIRLVPAFGALAGGTTVIIEGENFPSSVTVTFDGVSATSIQVIDSQHISCVTPLSADVGFVDVVVT